MNRFALALASWLAIQGVATAAGADKTPPTPTAAPTRLSATYLQSVYRYLIAEVAKQRGQGDLALQLYNQLLKDYPDPVLAKIAVETAARQGHLGNALDYAVQWNAISPADPIAQQWLISLALRSPSPSNYSDDIQRILRQAGPRLAETWLSIAARAAEGQQKLALANLIDEWAAPYGDVAEAWWAKALAAQNRGQQEAALNDLGKAMSLKPDWEAAAVQHARLTAQRAPADGLAELQKFIKTHPNANEAKLANARLLVADKQYPAAKSAFMALRKDMPENPDIPYAIGVLAIQDADDKTAEAAFKDALQLGYGDTDTIYLMLGELTEKRGALNDAIEAYQNVDGSSFAMAQLRIADILNSQNRFDEALANLDQASTQQPAMQNQFLGAKLVVLRKAKRYQAAYDLLTARLAIDKNNPGLLYERAMMADRLDKLDLLQKDLQSALKLDPNHAQSLNALGYTLADRLDKAAEGLPMIQRAVDQEPDNPAFIDSLGWAQYKLGKLTEAEASLRKAYSIDSDAEIAAHLGEVLWVTGKHEEALSIWHDAQSKEPERQEISATMKRLQAQ
ncbi:tetratricopeptide repeat protein [Leeia oryzae]|uniref:tetratricopeptide repeat protein n=1 Tax=Leeia oryzae TaxID=356662 RepID=UPI00037F2E25|nr:tetratricopeptide repeat protein [Leeia oryzae]